ncbi:EAL domain-containing protein [Thiomonas sp.]
MHYQPIRHLPSGRVLYSEALLRSPSQDTEAMFRQAADRGNSNRLERSALQLILADVRAGHLGTTPIGVNLSQKALVEDAGSWRALRQLARIQPFFLEITEQHTATDRALMRKRLDTLIQLGIRLVLDDFGTGHANVLYLLDTPFEFVKLDKRWIPWFRPQRSRAAEQRQRFCLGLLAGLRDLGHQIILEGLEDERESGARARELGIQYGQGYALGIPRRHRPDSLGGQGFHRSSALGIL